MTMPLRSTDFYLWYELIGNEVSIKFALLSPSGGNLINVTCKLLDSEWERSQQWS